MSAEPVVAGTISRSVTTIPAVIAEWAGWLRDKGRKPKTIEQYTESVTQIALAVGWGDVAEVNGDEAEEYMLSKSRAGVWSGQTFDHKCSTLRTFGRFLVRRGYHKENPFAKLEDTGAPSGEGSRPMTLEQARALVLTAYQTQALTPRTRGERWAVYAWMLTTGLRCGETASIRWRDIDLGAGLLVTDPSWDKSGRRAYLPLSADARRILDHQRSRYPHGPEDRVFPHQPTRLTFRADAKRAGIPVVDERGNPVSLHSCRKTYATLLDGVGATPGERNALMRHQDGVPGRYNRPELARLSAVLARLPSVFPGFDNFGGIGEKDSRPGPGSGDDVDAKTRTDGTDDRNPPQLQQPACPVPSGFATDHLGKRASAVGSLGDGLDRLSALTPISGLKDSGDLARVLAATASLLNSVAQALAPKGDERGDESRSEERGRDVGGNPH